MLQQQIEMRWAVLSEVFGSRAVSQRVFLFLDLLEMISLNWHHNFLEVEFQSYFFEIMEFPLKRAIFCQQILIHSGQSTHILLLPSMKTEDGEKNPTRRDVIAILRDEGPGKIGSCRPIHPSIQSTWRCLREKPSSLTWKRTMAFPEDRRSRPSLSAV